MGLTLARSLEPQEAEAASRETTCAVIIHTLKSVRLHLPPTGEGAVDELRLITESQFLPTVIEMWGEKRSGVARWMAAQVLGAQNQKCMHRVNAKWTLYTAMIDQNEFIELMDVERLGVGFYSGCRVYVAAIGLLLLGEDISTSAKHAVPLIFHLDRKQVEILDSNGYTAYSRALNASVHEYIKNVPSLAGWKVDLQVMLCPYENQQLKMGYARGPQAGTGGTCTIWTALYMFLRLVCYNSDPIELQEQLLLLTSLERAVIVRNYLALEWQVQRYYIEAQAPPTSLKTIDLFGLPFYLSSRKTVGPALHERGVVKAKKNARAKTRTHLFTQ